MNRFVILLVVLLAISSGGVISGINLNRAEFIPSNRNEQDSLQKLQALYNGILWENKYHRVSEDQFLFSDFFLPGTISINSMICKNLRIRYDIYSDEIMTPLDQKEILQLNKEMVDSFTFSFENKAYHFINIKDESFKGFTGYVNVLYNGESSLYVKYRKEILLSGANEYNIGRFYQTSLIYFVKDNIVNIIKSKNDLYKILNEQKTQIRNFITNNKLKVSKKIPESFVPVIRYYDSISQ
jgi:hypothetical protein